MQKGFSALILLIGLFLILVLIILVVYFFSDKQYHSLVELNKKLPPVPSPNASPKSVVPEGWKTYTNFTYGYQISYPPEWSAYSDETINTKSQCVENDPYATRVYIYPEKTQDCYSQDTKFEVILGSKFDNIYNIHGSASQNKFKFAGEDATQYYGKVHQEIVFNHGNYGFTLFDFNQELILNSFVFLKSDQLSQIPTPKPTPIAFIKKYYDSNTQNIPAEVRNMSDKDLIGMYCSPSSNDPKIKSIEPSLPKTNIGYWYCYLDSGQILFAIYESSLDKNGELSVSATFGIWDQNKFTPKITFDPGREAGAPATGFTPLEYTKNGVLYYSRDFGDNTSFISTFKIDLTQGKQTIIQNCGEVFENGSETQSKMVCKSP